MAIRYGGRALGGAIGREIEKKLRNKGLARDVYRAIQRGDSPTSINNIMKRVGINLNRLQVADYISQRYAPRTSTRYYDRVALNHGTKSKINMEQFRRAGWGNKIVFTVQITRADGTRFSYPHEIDGSQYESFSSLLKDVEKDMDKPVSPPPMKGDQREILAYSVTN